VLLGELSLKPVFFSGRDRVHVKRKALDYWYQNRQSLGLNLCAFLCRCTLSGDGRTITFTAPESSLPASLMVS
jgi:hypothetical protein